LRVLFLINCRKGHTTFYIFADIKTPVFALFMAKRKRQAIHRGRLAVALKIVLLVNYRLAYTCHRLRTDKLLNL
jgi:hypothetical protein